MKLKIGICDDNLSQVDLIQKYISQYLREHEITIYDSTNPEAFIQLLGQHELDIAFLDIDMGEVSGIDIGKHIRKHSKNTVIVFITAYDHYAVDAFEVRAFHYLLKPCTGEKVDKLLKELLIHLKHLKETREDQFFWVKTKKESIRVNYRDIHYFEKIGHKIRIITSEDPIDYYDNFSNLAKLVDSTYFLRCHQGYIVNIHKINSLKDKTLFLEDQVKLPVSRSYYKAVNTYFTNKLFEKRCV